MANLKRCRFRAAAAIVVLGSAAAAYQLLGIVGVAVSGADDIGNLHAGWFPLRFFAAISAARISAGWVFALREKVTLPQKGEGI
jgi:lipopolysaccharide export LptBFGC system permease protein LptF